MCVEWQQVSFTHIIVGYVQLPHITIEANCTLYVAFTLPIYSYTLSSIVRFDGERGFKTVPDSYHNVRDVSRISFLFIVPYLGRKGSVLLQASKDFDV